HFRRFVAVEGFSTRNRRGRGDWLRFGFDPNRASCRRGVILELPCSFAATVESLGKAGVERFQKHFFWPGEAPFFAKFGIESFSSGGIFLPRTRQIGGQEIDRCQRRGRTPQLGAGHQLLRSGLHFENAVFTDDEPKFPVL